MERIGRMGEALPAQHRPSIMSGASPDPVLDPREPQDRRGDEEAYTRWRISQRKYAHGTRGDGLLGPGWTCFRWV